MPNIQKQAREVILALSVKHNFDWDAIYNAILNKRDMEDLDQINIDPYIDCITIIDEDYPDELKRIYKPPFVIFKNVKKGEEIK